MGESNHLEANAFPGVKGVLLKVFDPFRKRQPPIFYQPSYQPILQYIIRSLYTLHQSTIFIITLGSSPHFPITSKRAEQVREIRFPITQKKSCVRRTIPGSSQNKLSKQSLAIIDYTHALVDFVAIRLFLCCPGLPLTTSRNSRPYSFHLLNHSVRYVVCLIFVRHLLQSNQAGKKQHDICTYKYKMHIYIYMYTIHL